jgi:hypothetical protein
VSVRRFQRLPDSAAAVPAAIAAGATVRLFQACWHVVRGIKRSESLFLVSGRSKMLWKLSLVDEQFDLLQWFWM